MNRNTLIVALSLSFALELYLAFRPLPPDPVGAGAGEAVEDGPTAPRDRLPLGGAVSAAALALAGGGHRTAQEPIARVLSREGNRELRARLERAQRILKR